MEFLTVLALNWIAITFLAFFFLLLVLGTVADRNDSAAPKWYIFGAGFVLVVGYFWKDWTFVSVWDGLMSWTFWKPVVVYFGIGLVYSLIEFLLNIRRSVRFYTDAWKKHLSSEKMFLAFEEDGSLITTTVNGRLEQVTRRGTIAEVYSEVAQKGALSGEFNDVLRLSKDFIQQHSFNAGIIEIVLDKKTKVTPVPQVNRSKLAEHIGAWTFFWPFYLVSLIVGDLLIEVFRSIANFISRISGRLVRISFANVFKF